MPMLHRLQERALDRELGNTFQDLCSPSRNQNKEGWDPVLCRTEAVIFISQQPLLPASHDPGNHSCVPNAETSFPENNFLLHVTALEDIKPGEVRGLGAVEGREGGQ